LDYSLQHTTCPGKADTGATSHHALLQAVVQAVHHAEMLLPDMYCQLLLCCGSTDSALSASCKCPPTCVAVEMDMPAPLAFNVLSTYARSLATVLSGPEGGTHAPLLASGELPAGHCRHRWKALPLSRMLLMTLPAAAVAHLQEPVEERLAGCHAALNEKPPAKLVSLPLVGSHSTQLSPSAAGKYPAAC
jgi:hypothetical protein